MSEDYCPECGHLLSKNLNKCFFCEWDESFDQLTDSLSIENGLTYHGTDEYRPDQLPGF